MPLYVLMTKLSPETLHGTHDRRKEGQRWKERVERSCPQVKWIAHYALLGQFDFMGIYEAPDRSTALQVSLVSRAEGAMTAESWPAVPYDEFLKLYDEVQERP